MNSKEHLEESGKFFVCQEVEDLKKNEKVLDIWVAVNENTQKL